MFLLEVFKYAFKSSLSFVFSYILTSDVGAFDKVNIVGKNIVLATAHPSKFPEAIKKSINLKSDLPQKLRFVMDEKENFDIIENNVDKVKHHIMERI